MKTKTTSELKQGGILKKNTLIFKVLVLLLIFLYSCESYSQRAWQENRFYAYRGGTDVICGVPYSLSKWNEYRSWTETWQNCRKRVWHQEFYSGYIYYWGPKGWYREWKEGNFWYFNWYDYPVRIS